MDVSTISNIWNTIVQSNTFNFIIFVAILGWVVVKIDVKSIIASLQQKILKLIDDAKKEKEIAEDSLRNAEKAIENLEHELTVIVKEAEKSAEVIGSKILTEAKKHVDNIKENAQKVIAAEEKLLISKLTKNTSHASVETAKSHIQNVLVQSPEMHEKYINESIDELDRLNF